GIAAEGQLRGLGQLFAADFQSMVFTGFQFGDTLFVDIETQDSTFFAKLYSQGQTNISQTYNGQFHLINLQLSLLLLPRILKYLNGLRIVVITLADGRQQQPRGTAPGYQSRIQPEISCREHTDRSAKRQSVIPPDSGRHQSNPGQHP